MHALLAELSDSMHHLHEVFSSRVFIAICQIVLRFLESKKENMIWYHGSGYALGILDDFFASEMQRRQCSPGQGPGSTTISDRRPVYPLLRSWEKNHEFFRWISFEKICNMPRR